MKKKVIKYSPTLSPQRKGYELRIFFLFLVVLLFIIEIKAQAPEIISVNPNFNEIANATIPEISASFNVSMDSSSFDSLSFSMTGERSADHTGKIIYNEVNKTVTFNSINKFSSGERVTVTLSNKIKSSQGDSSQGFIWTFRIPSQRVGVNFSEAKEYNAGGWGMQCIDMNNDGSPDIVTSSGIILINDGNGNFPTQWTINGLDYTLPICANDFNRDGFIDLFYYGANGLTIGLGDGKGDFQESSLNWYWYYFTVADFNGDGYPDIAGINSTPGDPDNPITDWGIAFNDGEGNFKDTVSIKVAGGGVGNRILATDLDNNGDMDIIISSNYYCCGPNLTTYGLDGIIVARNNGKGIFKQYELYSSDKYVDIWFAATLYSSDFNNDGYNDVAVMGYSGTVLLNFGDGTFHNDSASVIPFWDPEQGGSFTGGDVNGDGWIDIAISGYQFPFEPTSPREYGFIINRNGYISGISHIDTLPNLDIFSTALADLDGDDDLDLVHCGSSLYVTFNQDTITSVKDDFVQPKEFYLNQNFPNPFNSQTQITIELAKAENIRISIYNILGEEVRLLKDELFLPGGKHRVVWDGKDKNGSELSSGVYFIRAASLKSVQLIKAMLLK